VRQALERCDQRYYANDEPIADRLFAWIKRHAARISLPGYAEPATTSPRTIT
jgi:hypothetical protein